MTIFNLSATIRTGETEQADHFDLQDATCVGLVIPADFTGTSVTFQSAAADNDSEPGDFYAVSDSTGAEVDVTVAAESIVLFGPDLLLGARFLKLSAAEQVSDVQVGLICVRG